MYTSSLRHFRKRMSVFLQSVSHNHHLSLIESYQLEGGVGVRDDQRVGVDINAYIYKQFARVLFFTSTRAFSLQPSGFPANNHLRPVLKLAWPSGEVNSSLALIN